jgi:hypothetical protein
MATKRKTKKTQPKKNRTAGKRVTPVKKRVKKKLAKKKTPQKRVKKKLAKKKMPQKRVAAKTKALGNQAIGRKKPAAPEKQVRPVRRKSQSVDTGALFPEGPASRSSGQSGDLQGLSNAQGADSESVKELLEEGNAFEADAVMGVELAGDTEGGEVHTHELPEDDVPGEYLDEEQ